MYEHKHGKHEHKEGHGRYSLKINNYVQDRVSMIMWTKCFIYNL